MATFLGTVSHGRSSGAVASYTLSHTVDAGTDVLLLFVYAWVSAGAYTLDVDWNGAQATQRAQRITSTAFHAELWEIVTPTPATGDIVVTPSVNADMRAIALNVDGVQTPQYYRGSVPTALVGGNGSALVVSDQTGDTGLHFGGWSRPITGSITTDAGNPGTIGAVTQQAVENGGGSNGDNQAILHTFPFTTGSTTDLRTSSVLFRTGGAIAFAFLDATGGASIPALVQHLRRMGA